MGATELKRGVLTAPRTCNRNCKNEEPTDADASEFNCFLWKSRGKAKPDFAAASLWADPSARAAATEMLQKNPRCSHGDLTEWLSNGQRTNGCRISMAGLAQLLHRAGDHNRQRAERPSMIKQLSFQISCVIPGRLTPPEVPARLGCPPRRILRRPSQWGGAVS